MNLQGVVRVINIAIRAAFIVLGILLIVGHFQFPNIIPHFRILMGVVFIFYGAYRIVTLWLKKEVGQRP
jgi:ABC-type multidrug transport system permease subunit